MVIAWFDFKYKYQKIETPNRLKEILWFNSEIKIEDNIVYNKKAVKAGMIRLENILDENSRFLTYPEMDRRYPKVVTWLEYNSLKDAIPTSWRQYGESNHTESLCAQIEKRKHKTSFIYKALNVGNTVPLQANYDKMKKTLPTLERMEYQKAFTSLYQITNITKFRNVQYRLLVNAIFTNNRLYYWKKAETKGCDWCEHERQTPLHLLYSCKIVTQIWEKLQNFIQKCTNIDMTQVEINEKTVMLNSAYPKPMNIVNLLVLITKQNIFASKCMGKKPCFEQIIQNIESIYQLEKYNAQKADRINKHNMKWAPYANNTDQ